jgi:hypothetical protein
VCNRECGTDFFLKKIIAKLLQTLAMNLNLFGGHAGDLRDAPWVWAGRCAGLAMFCWASVHQYRCHAILYALRPSSAQPQRHSYAIIHSSDEFNLCTMGHKKIFFCSYSIPRGDWFELVSSPHYLAEILIYAAIGIVLQLQCRAWFFVVGFVVANLGWCVFLRSLLIT